jgi:predicted dehydrogenase
VPEFLNKNEEMKKVYNWGILAPGKIARKFALELKEVTDARIYAIASRDEERAKDFAAEFRAEKYYTNYEALALDPQVDIIYIASPHSFHPEQTKLCLMHHKAVLCEKALALNAREVESMISCARENHTFLMEAMMIPHQPSYQEAKRLIESGALGKIKYIQGWFGFNRAPYDLNHRLLNPELGGGALLDIGLYPLFDVFYFLGMPKALTANAALAPTGVDQTVSISLNYSQGVTASVFASFLAASGLGTDILCEKGTLHLRRLNAVDQWLEIEIPGEATQRLTWKSEECGLKQEALEVMRCLDAGKTESDRMSYSMSSNLMSLMDKIRSQIGVRYPGRDY